MLSVPHSREARSSRARPLVLVASSDAALVRRVAAQARASGYAVCTATSASGCLRVATAVGPDLVLLDPEFLPRLERMLHSHPVSAATRCMRIDPAAVVQRVWQGVSAA